MFGLGGISVGSSIQGVLVNYARSSLFDFVQGKIMGDDDKVDGEPSLYDILVGLLMRSLASSISEPAGSNTVGFASAGKTHGHHTIPEYMCGASKQVDLVDLPVAQHKLLHDELFLFDTAVTIGAKVYELGFQKKKAGRRMAGIAKVARTRQGRAAIGIGLAAFYSNYGFNGASWMELGRGQKTRAPLGVVFGTEAVNFAAKNHSYPTCKKGG